MKFWLNDCCSIKIIVNTIFNVASGNICIMSIIVNTIFNVASGNICIMSYVLKTIRRYYDISNIK